MTQGRKDKALAYINKMTVKSMASVGNVVSSFLPWAGISLNSFHNKSLVCYIFEASYILLSSCHDKKKKSQNTFIIPFYGMNRVSSPAEEKNKN